jgi:hypothetical protein
VPQYEETAAKDKVSSGSSSFYKGKTGQKGQIRDPGFSEQSAIECRVKTGWSYPNFTVASRAAWLLCSSCG